MFHSSLFGAKWESHQYCVCVWHLWQCEVTCPKRCASFTSLATFDSVAKSSLPVTLSSKAVSVCLPDHSKCLPLGNITLPGERTQRTNLSNAMASVTKRRRYDLKKQNSHITESAHIIRFVCAWHWKSHHQTVVLLGVFGGCSKLTQVLEQWKTARPPPPPTLRARRSKSLGKMERLEKQHAVA